MKLRAAGLYARVSTPDQSAQMQIEALREFAAKRGWDPEEYIDVASGISASRPELDRLMEDCRRRRLDVVCVWKFDRFARSTRHLVTALEEFQALGIAFVSYTESIDTTTPYGKMIFTVLGAVAELERELIRERTREGVRKARRNGKRIGRPRAGPDPAEVVRLHTGDAIQEPLSFRAIAKRLDVSVGWAANAFKKAQANL